jgi:hypothetical protein
MCRINYKYILSGISIFNDGVPLDWFCIAMKLQPKYAWIALPFILTIV